MFQKNLFFLFFINLKKIIENYLRKLRIRNYYNYLVIKDYIALYKLRFNFIQKLDGRFCFKIF